jgi:hypothetical protein
MIYQHFGGRNEENVWIMLAVRLRSAVSGISQHLVRVRGSRIFFPKNYLTAKVCNSSKEIPADMHTSYQCKRVKDR